MADLYRSPADAARIEQWCRQRLGRWSVPHDTENVATSLGSTHLTGAGTGEEAVCLYLPGTNFNAAASTEILTTLSARWRVVCADLPGQPGQSAAARPDDEVAGYGQWVAEVVEHVRRKHPRLPLVVVGHSRGAAAALTADPAQVEGLVLVSPAGLAKVRVTPTVLRRSIAWLMRPTDARSRRLVDLMAGASGDAALEPLVDWMTLVARCTRTTGAPGPLPTGVVERWHGQNVRVLVGERDVFFPPTVVSGPAQRLGVPIDVVAGAGHLLVDQRPDVVAGAVAAVLS